MSAADDRAHLTQLRRRLRYLRGLGTPERLLSDLIGRVEALQHTLTTERDENERY